MQLRRSFIVSTLITALSLLASAQSKEKKQGDSALIASPLINVIKQLQGTVVQIAFARPGEEVDAVAMGSGFWISDTYVGTCWHVTNALPAGSSILVRTRVADVFADDGTLFANWSVLYAKVVASDQATDIAILKVGNVTPGDYERLPKGTDIKIATLRDDLPEPGTSAVLMGFPLGEPYLVTQQGPVAAVGFNLPIGPIWSRQMRILVSTVANHGNSGGPVFDDHGKVIGLLETALPSVRIPNIPNIDPALVVSGLAVVVPIQSLQVVAKQAHIDLSAKAR